MGFLARLFGGKKKASPTPAPEPAPTRSAPAPEKEAPVAEPVVEAVSEPVAEPVPVQEPAASAAMEKRAAILVGNNVTVKANGEVQKAEGFRNHYVYEDEACFSVSGLTAKAEGLVAGSYKQTISGKAVVKDADGNDVSDRFRVTVMPGTLSITP